MSEVLLHAMNIKVFPPILFIHYALMNIVDLSN